MCGIWVKNDQKFQAGRVPVSGVKEVNHSMVVVFCLVCFNGNTGRNQGPDTEMAARKTSFSRKLHIAFGAMLVITLALAWYFYDSVQWFEYDVERITIANSVLNGHRILSAQTAEKISLIEDSVSNGKVSDLQRWHDNTQVLRTSVIEIRQALAEENELRGSDEGAIDALNELESLSELIIAAGESIRVALEEQRAEDALSELELLRSNGTEEMFSELMLEALAASSKKLADANTETISLAHYITGVLPLFMLTLVGLTAMIAWLFSRSLTRSVNELHHGAEAFSNDDLNHRIPELHEKEFERLGTAFNTMARQLAEHRAAMRDSNIRLEAIVEERTRALKSSNETLEQVDENRRKLLADISHEFRTPLTVIRGEAEIALRGKVKTKAEYQETLERIMEQSDQTTRLVDDLLFIARADAGEPRLKVRLLSLNDILAATCADFSSRAEKNKIDIKQELGTRDIKVMGDSGRLRQVFSILIDNALRYSAQHQTVTVSLSRNDEEIVVKVQDMGIGLTKDEVRQAFQRFFRGGKAQSHARGTGLGLPVAKAIVEAHKGRISLDGEPGEGALATVTLPVEDKLKAVA
jgi:signal transduction histidine kinase